MLVGGDLAAELFLVLLGIVLAVDHQARMRALVGLDPTTGDGGLAGGKGGDAATPALLGELPPAAIGGEHVVDDGGLVHGDLRSGSPCRLACAGLAGAW